MIQLIVGNKGSGKTKTLIEMTNKAANESMGNVVCVEKGLKLTHDITHKARLVDTEEYEIDNFENLFGFLSGLLAGNYDITHIFVDTTLKIGGKDFVGFEKMIDKLTKLPPVEHVILTFTVSCDKTELPESILKYII